MPSKGRLSLFLKDVTVKELAQAASVDIGYVSHCLSGKKRASKKLVSAAQRLGFEAAELFNRWAL